jgi:DNA mismatch endonuclease, patch repair protein
VAQERKRLAVNAPIGGSALPPAPSASSADTLRRMRAQRRRDTQPELALRRELYRRGLRYLVDRPVISRGRRRHDIVFVGARLVVDVRGCFWHCCPLHASKPKANSSWGEEKLARNVERDKETEALLSREGWHVLVVWEHESVIEAADRVQAAVAMRRHWTRRSTRAVMETALPSVAASASLSELAMSDSPVPLATPE